MVGCRDNSDQNEGRVSKADEQIKELPESILAYFAIFECPAKETGVVDHRHADAEGVAKVHGRHGCKLVDVLAAHPYTLRIVVANSVEEAMFLREQARRHARVDDEGDKCTEVRQRHRPAGNSECVERRRNVVVPADETIGC